MDLIKKGNFNKIIDSIEEWGNDKIMPSIGERGKYEKDYGFKPKE